MPLLEEISVDSGNRKFGILTPKKQKTKQNKNKLETNSKYRILLRNYGH